MSTQKPALPRRVLLSGVLAAPAVLTACSSPSPESPTTTAPTRDPQKGKPGHPWTITVYGDSITAGGADVIHGTAFGARSWARHVTSETVKIIGGTAVNGIWTEKMLDHAVPAESDFVLAELGTNDLLSVKGDIPLSKTLTWSQESMKKLAAAVRAEGARLVIASVGPRPADEKPELVEPYNAAMKSWAAGQGHGYIDPWSRLRGADGHFPKGLSDDGLHPNTKGAAVLGANLRAELEKYAKAHG